MPPLLLALLLLSSILIVDSFQLFGRGPVANYGAPKTWMSRPIGHVRPRHGPDLCGVNPQRFRPDWHRNPGPKSELALCMSTSSEGSATSGDGIARGGDTCLEGAVKSLVAGELERAALFLNEARVAYANEGLMEKRQPLLDDVGVRIDKARVRQALTPGLAEEVGRRAAMTTQEGDRKVSLAVAAIHQRKLDLARQLLDEAAQQFAAAGFAIQVRPRLHQWVGGKMGVTERVRACACGRVRVFARASACWPRRARMSSGGGRVGEAVSCFVLACVLRRGTESSSWGTCCHRVRVCVRARMRVIASVCVYGAWRRRDQGGPGGTRR